MDIITKLPWWTQHNFAGSVAPSFLPSDLTNMTFWFDPSDDSKMTQAGGKFSAAMDKSGNGNGIAQGVGANQPTVSTFPNGRQCFGLDGTATYMTRAALNIGTSFTFIWAGYFSAALTRMYWLSKAGSGGGVEVGTQFVEMYDGTNAADFSVAGNVLSTPLILTVTMGTPATAKYYINNVSIGSTGTSGATWTGGFSIVDFFRRANNDFFVNGKGGEMILYSDVKTAPDLLSLYTYMAARWL